MITPLIIGLGINGWNVHRAFQREGVPTVIVDHEPGSIFWKCKGAELVQAPALSGDPLIETLERLASDGREYLLISAIEGTVAYLNVSRDRVPRNIRLDFPAPDVVDLCLDKKLFYVAAKKVDAPVYPMYFFDSRWRVEGGVEQVRFPAVLKTRAKMYIKGAYIQGLAKAYRVADREALQKVIDTISVLPGLDPADVLLQEWVAGEDSNIVFVMQYYDASSEPLISFVGKKIRQWMPETGGSASATMTRDDEALQAATTFFRSVGMRGICSMEFKRSAKDGRLSMIEPTTCRANYQEGAAVANGYNIPYAMYCAAAGLPRYQPRPVSRPVVWLHAGSDYQSALYYIERGRLTRSEWLRSLAGPKEYAIYTPADRGPFLELVRRKIAGRLNRRAAQ